MHDSSMMKGIIAKAQGAAQDAGARRVTAVRIRVGSLSGISPGHLREHYDDAAAGTSLEGSMLEIEEGPGGIDALDDPWE